MDNARASNAISIASGPRSSRIRAAIAQQGSGYVEQQNVRDEIRTKSWLPFSFQTAPPIEFVLWKIMFAGSARPIRALVLALRSLINSWLKDIQNRPAVHLQRWIQQRNAPNDTSPINSLRTVSGVRFNNWQTFRNENGEEHSSTVSQR
jgi:hypothetical protein